ncbi:MAG: aminomethyltransferase [Candidatus Deianiraeaceae bacterium]|jgi:aminomethyltransferase
MSLKTPLYASHIVLNATVIDFAGYLMPLQYKGLIEEHLWVRKSCGIFDVSHMGQVIFEGKNLNDIFSKLTPSNFEKVKEGVCKYTVLTNLNGGIIDDLIITKLTQERFFVVWNASRKHEDMQNVLQYFPDTQHTVLNDRALIAIQGVKAFEVIANIFPQYEDVKYMHAIEFEHEKYGHIFLTRTGYTGERGFEVSVSAELAPQLWNELLQDDSVRPIGLGARDTLRLEAGYPLYGNDIDLNTTPKQAGIGWTISKEHFGFIGNDIILNDVPKTKRVGIILEDKGVLRAGYEIFNGEKSVGKLTSGGYSPVLERSIGQAYVPVEFELGHAVYIQIRGKMLKATVRNLSFVETNPK